MNGVADSYTHPPLPQRSNDSSVEGSRAAQGRFRPDIDGLRAIAVIAVVLFQTEVPGIGGGFIGVDVFYVISGFLITGSLWRELSTAGSIQLRGPAGPEPV